MAVATATLTLYPYPKGVDNTQRRKIVQGTCAIQASPATYATGGLAITWSQIAPSASADGLTEPTATPLLAEFFSVGGTGFIYGYNKSTGKLQIFTGAAAQSALTELSAAAVPAGVSGDTIEFYAEFIRNI